jgi:pseudouridine kinase
MKKHNVCVIGGINFAVISQIDSDLQSDSSIIGNIKVRFGGVARNIILNLTKYDDINIDFVTVLSNDMMGVLAQKELDGWSVSYDKSLFMEKWESYYCETITKRGHYGINDMKLVTYLTPEYLKNIKPYIESHDIAVIDLNLNQNTVEYIAANINIPVVCDATSDQKCRRIINVLDRISILKMNYRESCALLGIQPCETPDIDCLKTAMQDLSVPSCYVTLGELGAFYLSKDAYCYRESKVKIAAKNVLGAGDAFTAGIIEGALHKMPVESILDLGICNAENVLLQNNPNGGNKV